MLIIEIEELKKAKALIDRINSVPLDQIEWRQNGEILEINKCVMYNWKFTGLSNNSFAYATFLSKEK